MPIIDWFFTEFSTTTLLLPEENCMLLQVHSVNPTGLAFINGKPLPLFIASGLA
jgi:hypothetical protein